MISRIPQRSKTDCVICVTAMIMGPSYSYERILQDSTKYPKVLANGKFYPWWEKYLQDEGYRVCYRPFLDVYQLARFRGSVVGLLAMDIPHLQWSHIVCVDEIGIIDPADGAPDHIDIGQYVLERRAQCAFFHDEFLAVERLPDC
jgi:hypothetical protein